MEHKWARARKRAGLKNRIMHDLRRTAARDFRRAGVSEGEIMKLCGWKTRAMFDRYNIIDEADLASAVVVKNGTNKLPVSATPGPPSRTQTSSRPFRAAQLTSTCASLSKIASTAFRTRLMSS